MSTDYQSIYKREFSRKEYSRHDHNEIGYKWPSLRIPPTAKTLIDVGAGRGIFLDVVQARCPWLNLTAMDIEKFGNFNCEFVQQDMTNPTGEIWSRQFDVVMCIGVLEHIAPDQIDVTLYNLSKLGNLAVFTIANHSDMGQSGELHLIQESSPWWAQKLLKHWDIVESEDVYGGRLLLYRLHKKLDLVG